jgi:parallel beta-helix repeat protein
MKKNYLDHLRVIVLSSLFFILLVVDAKAFAVNGSFYIAPDGNDNNDGTIEKPFATLARARNAVRELKKKKHDGDITVFIRGGSYAIHETVVFGLEDSGSNNQVITYAAYPDEEPVFSSGVKLSGWTKLSEYPPELPQVARGKIWVANIPQTKNGKWRFYTLFDGDKMLPRARGKGWVPEGDPPEDWWMGVFASIEDKTTIGFPEGALKNWQNLEDVEIRVFPAGYTMNILGLESVDENKRVARTIVPATYPIRRWPEDGNPPSAWVENVLEALDEPGEWVLNTQQGRLYLWPEQEKPGDHIVAPKLTELVRVEGKIDLKGHDDIPVKYLVFKGLTFTHGDRDLWTKDDAGIQHDWEMHDKSSALVRFRGAEQCVIDECRFSNTGGTGLRFDLHSQYNRVHRSLFDYLGQVAILIDGYGPGTKDVSFRNSIINNHIHHVGEIYKHGHGIIIWQSRDNHIANNLIHDGPRKAILVSGVRGHFFDTSRVPKNNRECSKQIRWDEIGGAKGWNYIAGFLHNHNNIIENNETYRMCKIGIDGAVINITGNGEGNVIRRNYIHDIVNDGPDGIIRLDANGRGTLITENIIYNCSPQGIVLNDRNNHVENNIVIDTGKDPHEDWQRYMIYYRGGPRPGRIQRNVLYFSDTRSNFFTTRRQTQAKGYPGDYNLYFSVGAPDSGKALLNRLHENGTDSHSLATDPLFVDFENQDFRLKPESPMFKLGFKQIDTDKIGLREDFPERYKTGL